jgi:hypothetical protein
LADSTLVQMSSELGRHNFFISVSQNSFFIHNATIIISIHFIL